MTLGLIHFCHLSSKPSTHHFPGVPTQRTVRSHPTVGTRGSDYPWVQCCPFCAPGGFQLPRTPLPCLSQWSYLSVHENKATGSRVKTHAYVHVRAHTHTECGLTGRAHTHTHGMWSDWEGPGSSELALLHHSISCINDDLYVPGKHGCLPSCFSYLWLG